MGGPRQETEADGNEGPDDLSVEQDQEPQDSPDMVSFINMDAIGEIKATLNSDVFSFLIRSFY